jgi:hypothetical protein
MTSQIILLNGFGVAIASDSAMTTGRGNRTYQTAEKIVPLPPPHRVAVTHSGSVRIGNLPYSVLVGEWARQLGDKPLRSIRAYQDHFLDWLESNDQWFAGETESNQILRFVDERIRHTAKIFTDIKEDDPDFSLDEMIGDWTAEVAEYPRMEGTSINDALSLLNRYREDVEKIINDRLGEILTPEADRANIYNYLATFYSSTVMPDATLVFTGYAERDILPAWSQVDIFGFVNRKITWIENSSYSLTPDLEPLWSICLPAQRDAINQYLMGYDHKHVDGITENVLDFMDDMTNQLKEKFGISEEKAEEFEKSIHEKKEELAESIRGFTNHFSEESYLRPLRSAISILPSGSLVDVARSLIELQALRQTTTAQLDTVGGPIDVAMISPIDGFQWIRHKTIA